MKRFLILKKMENHRDKIPLIFSILFFAVAFFTTRLVDSHSILKYVILVLFTILGFFVGNYLKNKKMKLICLVAVLLLLIYICVLLLLVRNIKNDLQGIWETRNSNDLNFKMNFVNQEEVYIGLSPQFNMILYKYKYDNECFDFYNEENMNTFEWCTNGLVYDDSLFVVDEFDTVIFYRIN